MAPNLYPHRRNATLPLPSKYGCNLLILPVMVESNISYRNATSAPPLIYKLNIVGRRVVFPDVARCDLIVTDRSVSHAEMANCGVSTQSRNIRRTSCTGNTTDARRYEESTPVTERKPGPAIALLRSIISFSYRFVLFPGSSATSS